MDKKITQLTQVTELTGAELLPLAQSGVTKSASVDQLRGYKVYTALLTQSGGDDPQGIGSGDLPLVVGVTYMINGGFAGDDFTNVGGPLITYNGEFDGYYFVATGTIPNNWTNGTGLVYNTGAPVVTVLENTIGNIWFTYIDIGRYSINSNGLFPIATPAVFIGNNFNMDGYPPAICGINEVTRSTNTMELITVSYIDGNLNDLLLNTPIEIRVYP